MVENIRCRKAFMAACKLIPKVIAATSDFPKEEAFGLTLELRKTTIAAAVNIAAGASGKTIHASVACLHLSQRQLHAVCDHIAISGKRGFLSEETGGGLVRECHVVIGLLKERIARVVN